MTKVTFETATFADAIKKADRIAPSKGKSFDKAAGVLIEIDPANEPPVIVRATNLDIYSMEWVDTLAVEGEAMTWRLPSSLLAQTVSSLPIGSGATVTFENITDNRGHHIIQMTTSGRTKAKFNTMRTEDYPSWSAFDPDNLYRADDIGGRIAQVEWAAAKSDTIEVLAGIHFDGQTCLATDRYKLACAELKIPDLEFPVTAPAGLLGQILKKTGEVSIGVSGGQLLIMPDEHTQLRAVLFGADYPNAGKIMKRNKPQIIKLKRGPLLDIINRANNFSGADRFPTLRVFFGNEEVAVMMNNEEIGLLGDVVEVPGQAVHKRFEVRFSPKNLTDALAFAPNDEIEIGYDTSDSKGIIYINGGSGYEAWVMPRGDVSTEEK